MHQTWLEYGPTLGQVRQANRDVRQLVSDMGTEIAICDFQDTVAQCLSQRGQAPLPSQPPPGQPAGSGSKESFMFPLALFVPGTQHLLDNALKDMLHSLPMWKTWQAQAKVVCQWLASTAHREFLQERLRVAHPDTPDWQLALKKKPDKFAAWRWQTLANVTRDLERMESAVVAALATVSEPADLKSKDAHTARAFLDATQDLAFWNCARGLRQLCQPVRRLSGWAKGCDCHGDQLAGGQDIDCVWKGCRATSFATRIRDFQAEIAALRSQAETGCIPGFSSLHVLDSLTHLLGYVRLKFNWVFEPPYTIWTLDSRQAACDFLAAHDALVAEGGSPHRVVAHFAGPSSRLRSALEAFRDGRVYVTGVANRDCIVPALHPGRHLG